MNDEDKFPEPNVTPIECAKDEIPSKKNKPDANKIKIAKDVATASKWAGKAAGFVGAFLKNIPGSFTEMVGTALELTSTITEDKLSKKIEDLEKNKEKT